MQAIMVIASAFYITYIFSLVVVLVVVVVDAMPSFNNNKGFFYAFASYRKISLSMQFCSTLLVVP